ncbi:MAG: ABC transporter permease [Chlamydia sp.]
MIGYIMVPIALHRVSALLKKEIYQIRRDPSSLLISIVLPLILLFIYGVGVSLDINHIRLGLVLEDRSPEAVEFSRALLDSSYFEITTSNAMQPLRDKLIDGSIRGIIVIPAHFSSSLHRFDTEAPVQIICDGSEPNTANFVKGYVTGAFSNWIQSNSRASASTIQVNSRYWYNPSLESRNFLIPGSLAIIMALIGTLLTALVIAREWERGTMESMISTPVRMVEIMIGKLIPYFFLGLGTMAICCCISIFIYDIPFRGSLFALLLVTASFLFTALGQGLLISTATKNQFIAGQISMFTAFLPAFMLSGFLFEIASMPAPIRAITYFLPARYLAASLQTLFLVGDIWQLFIVDIAVMLLLGTLFFAYTARISVKRL